MAKRREEEAAARMEKEKLVLAQAKVMVRWMTPLFWLMIAGIVFGEIAGLFVDEAGSASKLTLFGITALLRLGETLCIWRLSAVHLRYRTAALWRGGYVLWALACEVLTIFLVENIYLQLLLGLPSLVMQLLSIYHFLEANGSAVVTVDGELADKWNHLWQRMVYSYVGIFLSPVAAAIIPLIGSLLLLSSMIALLVFSVQEYIFTWRTIETYKFYLE